MPGRPVNRKLVRRVYRRMGWGFPARDLRRAKARWTPIKAARPSQVWEMDHTLRLARFRRRLVLLLQRLDIFTRQCIAYRFDTLNTASVAVESLVEAVAAAKPDCSGPTLRCDSGSRCAGKRFRKAVSLPAIRLKLTRTRTPGPNGQIGSFHGTIKREYTRPRDFANHQQAGAVIAEAFRDYNRGRLHPALEYVPPDGLTASWVVGHNEPAASA